MEKENLRASAANEMKEVIITAKNLAVKVLVVELPRRVGSPEMAAAVAQLNSELDKICTELKVKFVETKGYFYMANGEPNVALMSDSKYCPF